MNYVQDNYKIVNYTPVFFSNTKNYKKNYHPNGNHLDNIHNYKPLLKLGTIFLLETDKQTRSKSKSILRLAIRLANDKSLREIMRKIIVFVIKLYAEQIVVFLKQCLRILKSIIGSNFGGSIRPFNRSYTNIISTT